MRIAIFTNAYKPIASGVVNAIDHTVNALKDKGHTVYIFAPGFEGYHDEGEDVYRYRSFHLNREVNFPVAIPFTFKVGKILAEFKPDIIHTHQPFVLGDAAYFYARKFKIPLVFTFHTQYEMYAHYLHLPENMVKYCCRRIIKRFAEKSDGVITPAQSIADMLKQYDIQSRIEVIPNAIDIDCYEDIPEDAVHEMKGRFGLENKRVILFVGRIAPEKNLEMLIDAFEIVYKQNTDARLLIVGDGLALPQLRSYADSKDLGGAVVFTGNVDYGKIPVFYKISDIFAITSTTEVKPLVILEALAARIPIVAVNAPGAMDTLTNGFDSILTRENAGEFSTGIIELLNDDSLYRKLKTGTCETARNYSIETVSEEIVDLYQNLINIKAFSKTSKHKSIQDPCAPKL